MQPLYTAQNVNPAYQLNWGLTLHWRVQPIDLSEFIDALKLATEPDGVRILSFRSTANSYLQFLLSTKPNVAAMEIVRCVKGRLQYLIRNNIPKAFQRNYALRSVGASTREKVEDYVSTQLGHHKMADPKVQARLNEFQVVYRNIDLSREQFSSHGKYWFNLHVVIVNEQRWHEINLDRLRKLKSMIEKSSLKHGHRLSRLALLSDHIHLTLGCNVDELPEGVVLKYLNNCAYVYGMRRVYKHSYYVGTIGEYDRSAMNVDERG